MVQPMEFEWDLSKGNENIREHGVSFAEAVEWILDPQGFQLTDSKHSGSKTRWYLIGCLATGHLLTHHLGLLNGESFGGSIMNQPNLRHLKIDRQGTELIRTALGKKGRGTITLNLDAADLCAAKTRSKKAGIPINAR
jgi:uncharacterized DUF497 family protein